jgi:signal transduction histidine kinase
VHGQDFRMRCARRNTPTVETVRRNRDLVLDVCVVLVALGGSFADTLMLEKLRQPYDVVMFAIFSMSALALWFRRRAPIAVGWIAVAATLATQALSLLAPNGLFAADLAPSEAPWFPTAVPFAAYGLMAFAGRAAWPPVVVLLILALAGSNPSDYSLQAGVPALLLTSGATALGMYTAARRRLLGELTEQARGEERVRLAAELHDVVTHRVSLMVLQAGALRLTAADEPTRLAAEGLRSTGCQALEELRDLVGILRDTESGTPIDLSVDLSALVAESESVGVPADLSEEGDPRLISPVVHRTAYRVVQEALTNARKHAPGARVRIRAAYRVDGVHLTVRNTAASGPVDPSLTAAGAGVGLLGLRQRIELIDGTLRAGPDGAGGFVVEATLPAYVPTARAASRERAQ